MEDSFDYKTITDMVSNHSVFIRCLKLFKDESFGYLFYIYCVFGNKKKKKTESSSIIQHLFSILRRIFFRLQLLTAVKSEEPEDGKPYDDENIGFDAKYN